MLLKKISPIRYVLLMLFCLQAGNNHASSIPPNDDNAILLSYKEKKSEKLCGKKPFYLNDIDITLSMNGELNVSLIQTSKSGEGFITHLSIEMLDKKGRLLTLYKTPTLTLKNNSKTQNYYFNENFKYQFSAEEFKIFIDNVKSIRVSYNGCNDPNKLTDEELLSRNLPKEIVEEFIHKTPLVVE